MELFEVLNCKKEKNIFKHSLYLSHTQITKLPDNLSVGGDLDLNHTQITSYPISYNCGSYSRAIYLDLKDKTKIHIGCFCGSKQEAIKAVESKYTDSCTYVDKINQCFAMWEEFN